MNETNNLYVSLKERWLLCGWDINEELLSIKKFNANKNLFSIVLGYFLIVISILKTINIFMIQSKKPHGLYKMAKYRDIVISSSAKHMHLNYFRHINPLTHTSFRIISAFDKNDFTSVYKLSFIEVLKELFAQKDEIFRWIGVDNQKLKWLIIKRVYSGLANYSYWILLLRELKESNPNIKLYNGGAYLVSCAASLVGVKTHYVAHGATDKFVVSPKYNEISLYSDEELPYYMLSNPGSKVSTYQTKKINQYKKSIVIFLDSYKSKDEMPYVFDLISFFNELNFKIIVKNHPSGTSLFNIFEHYPEIKFIDYFNLDASYILTKERPLFAAGGASTSLIEAKLMKIVPIIFTETKSKPSIQSNKSSVYRFYDNCMHWPKDANAIKYISSVEFTKAFYKFEEIKGVHGG